MNRRGLLWIPLVLLAALTVGFWLADWDHRLMDRFYDAERDVFLHDEARWGRILYDAAPVPAMLISVGGGLVALASIWKKNWRRFAKAGAYWFLVMVLGPGLIVNAVFKDWYGRPRPEHLVEYGGEMNFKPVLVPGWIEGYQGRAKSFPCGHASIGFYYMAGFFLWWRRNRRAACAALATGVLAGVSVGVARMAQGDHWPSDVLWAGAFVYFISYFLARIMGFLEPS